MMTMDVVKLFRTAPVAPEAAVRIRTWDDEAKDAERDLPATTGG